MKTIQGLKFIRILKLIKLLKLTKLKYTIAKIEDRITNRNFIAVMMIFKLQIYLFLIAHLISCLMLSISNENIEPDSFVNLAINKCESFTPGIGELYVTSLY